MYTHTHQHSLSLIPSQLVEVHRVLSLMCDKSLQIKPSSLGSKKKKKKKSEFTVADGFVPEENSGGFKNAESLIDLSTLLFRRLS